MAVYFYDTYLKPGFGATMDSLLALKSGEVNLQNTQVQAAKFKVHFGTCDRAFDDMEHHWNLARMNTATKQEKWQLLFWKEQPRHVLYHFLKRYEIPTCKVRGGTMVDISIEELVDAMNAKMEKVWTRYSTEVTDTETHVKRNYHSYGNANIISDVYTYMILSQKEVLFQLHKTSKGSLYLIEDRVERSLYQQTLSVICAATYFHVLLKHRSVNAQIALKDKDCLFLLMQREELVGKKGEKGSYVMYKAVSSDSAPNPGKEKLHCEGNEAFTQPERVFDKRKQNRYEETLHFSLSSGEYAPSDEYIYQLPGSLEHLLDMFYSGTR